MTRKALRLSAADVERVLTKGRGYQGSLIRSKVLPRATARVSRFSVVVSKKTAKTAVERNLLRRRVFEILSKEKGPAIPSDVVLFVGSKASFGQLRAGVHEALSRLQ